MSIVKYTTSTSSVLHLPLVELAKPENLSSVLEYIARSAPPCIADGLVNKLITDLVVLLGCTRKAAVSFINRLIRFFSS